MAAQGDCRGARELSRSRVYRAGNFDGGIPQLSVSVGDRAVLGFAFWGIGSLIVKGLKKGKQAIGDKTYREKLDAAGSRYWYIREHVRQGLASGQMGFKDAIRKLAATDLVQQFPYTFDEIEAHAFYFQQNEQK